MYIAGDGDVEISTSDINKCGFIWPFGILFVLLRTENADEYERKENIY